MQRFDDIRDSLYDIRSIYLLVLLPKRDKQIIAIVLFKELRKRILAPSFPMSVVSDYPVITVIDSGDTLLPCPLHRRCLKRLLSPLPMEALPSVPVAMVVKVDMNTSAA